MAVAGSIRFDVTGNGVGKYKISEGAVMKVRNSKFETRSKFEIGSYGNRFSTFTGDFEAQPGRFDLKAAEDSRTPRRWRAQSNVTASARSWSAAVLCRFVRGRALNHTHFRALNFGLRVSDFVMD
jgi:hypothetical protein